MTKKLEEFFDLPPADSDKSLVEYDDPIERSEEIKNQLSMSKKIDDALIAVDGLGEHEVEMNEIADRAMDSFEELMDLGKNTQDAFSGRIFENAVTMLDVALRAKQSKIDKKLKMIELQLKKQKLDKGVETEGGGQTTAIGIQFDRNQLLNILIKKE